VAHLGCKGNPTALDFLFAKGGTSAAIWREVAEKLELFFGSQLWQAVPRLCP